MVGAAAAVLDGTLGINPSPGTGSAGGGVRCWGRMATRPTWRWRWQRLSAPQCCLGARRSDQNPAEAAPAPAAAPCGTAWPAALPGAPGTPGRPVVPRAHDHAALSHAARAAVAPDARGVVVSGGGGSAGALRVAGGRGCPCRLPQQDLVRIMGTPASMPANQPPPMHTPLTCHASTALPTVHRAPYGSGGGDEGDAE